MRIRVVMILSLTGGLSPLGAQQIGAVTVGAAYSTKTHLLALRPRPSIRPDAGRFGQTIPPPDTLGGHNTSVPRALLGIAGATAGMFVGAALSGLGSPIEDARTGTIVGTLVGASVLAGAPRIGSGCSGMARVSRGFLGSVLGGALGTVAGFMTGNGGGVAILMATGAGTGAGIGASGCHRRAASSTR